MDPYNHDQVQAVWQRVLGKQDRQMLPAELEEMIAGEHAAAMEYGRLARQNPRYAPTLQAIGRDERKHAHRLMTLYRLHWGQNPKPAAGVAREAVSFSAGIGNAYREELAAAENYRRAAEKWPEHRKLFRSIAADEQRHSQILYRIAANLP